MFKFGIAIISIALVIVPCKLVSSTGKKLMSGVFGISPDFPDFRTMN